MKRITCFALILLLSLVFVSQGFCVPSGNHWGQTDLNRLLRKVLPFYFLSLGTSQGGQVLLTTSDVTIDPSYDVVEIVATTRNVTLSDGVPGQVLQIVSVLYSSGTMTIAPTTSTGWYKATMDANGETLSLQYVNDTYGWVIQGYYGTTISSWGVSHQ